MDLRIPSPRGMGPGAEESATKDSDRSLGSIALSPAPNKHSLPRGGAAKHTLARILRPFFRWLYADQLWNRDMSLELDRLVIENDRLRERLAEVDGGPPE